MPIGVGMASSSEIWNLECQNQATSTTRNKLNNIDPKEREGKVKEAENITVYNNCEFISAIPFCSIFFQVDEGYFVHFYAPPNLPTLDKHVIFVLDLSGSMFGTKLSQLKDAMVEILGDLRDKDFFSIILFSNKAHVWSLNSSNETLVMLSEDAPPQNLTFQVDFFCCSDRPDKILPSVPAVIPYSSRETKFALRKDKSFLCKRSLCG